MKTIAATLVLGAASVVSAACVSAPSPAKSAAAAAAAERPTFFNNTCTAENMTIRKEWRNLAANEKTAYLEAEKCLMSLPAGTTLSGVTNRFSDLQGLHRDKTNATVNGVYVGDIIHSVGQFLPWHRYYIHVHEYLLRNECNYTAPMPWWDEALDADTGNAWRSEMWNSDAFGGNGTGVDNCVIDGAFANYTEHIGPMLQNTEYCMSRVMDNAWAVRTASSLSVQNCTQHDDYENFYVCMVDAASSHKGIHTAVGGLMGDKDSSPGDPVFFLHHNYIDRMWWQWQTANPSSRLYDISGNTFNETYLEVEGIEAPANSVTTLDYVLNVADILDDVEIVDVMNAQNGLLCYEYDY